MEVDTINKKLNAILGIEVPQENTSVVPIENNNEVVEIDDSDIVSCGEIIPAENTVVNNEFEEDFEFARNNMKEISEMGMKAIKELTCVARDSQTPRIYEVLSNMMKNVSDINATIIDNHSKKISQQPVEEANSVKVNSIENAVFCTSYDVLKKIKHHK